MIFKKIVIFLIVTGLTTSIAYCAVFKGRIEDEKGAPIPATSVYITELKRGVSADGNGEFEIVIAPGSYSCEISSLGYKRIRMNIFALQDEVINKVIVMQEETFLLNEAVVNASDADIAVSIMRKAIARAPYFRKIVENYVSSVYFKGSVVIDKIPAMFTIGANKEEMSIVVGKQYVVEQFSEIKYNAPDQYSEEVKGVVSSIPAKLEGVGASFSFSSLLQTSIYDETVYGCLSPLSKDAMKYYRFEYEGMVYDEGDIINKIKVIPKRNEPDLLNGYLYIVDEEWSVSYMDLSFSSTGMDINVETNFNRAENILLPTTQNTTFSMSVLGIKARGEFYNSISYSFIDIKSEEDLPLTPISVQEVRKIKKDLEIKSKENTNMTRDSLAFRKDSSFWAMARTVPLSDEEQHSYLIRDSLINKIEEIDERQNASTFTQSTGIKGLDKFLYGGKLKISEKSYFGIGGLIKVAKDFNFVDGYQVGQNVWFSHKYNDHTIFRIEPEVYWTTHRKELIWNVKVDLRFAPLRNGVVGLSLGSWSEDISNNSAISPVINTFAVYLFGMNPIKYDSRKHARVFAEMDIANGLRAEMSIVADQRNSLDLISAKVLSKKRPDTNIPDNIYIPQDQYPYEVSSFYYKVSLSYTPQYYYMISNGKKRYIRSSWPTFKISNRATIASLKEESGSASYGEITFGVSQDIKTGLYSTLKYNIEAGGFYKKEKLSITDFHHFRASDIMFTGNGISDGFVLLDNYKYSTPDIWFSANINFTATHILIKWLPFVNTPLLKESLMIKTIYIPNKDIIHSEAGYMMSFMDAFKVGVFVGFESMKYQSVGFRIEIPFNIY